MKNIASLVFVLSLAACTDGSSTEVNTAVKGNYEAFPTLPSSTSEVTTIKGSMEWWFWEGDGGCFGTITDGRQNVELHSEADLCEPIEYSEGEEAVLSITFDSNKQYLPNGQKLYSIVKFGG